MTEKEIENILCAFRKINKDRERKNRKIFIITSIVYTVIIALNTIAVYCLS